MQSAYFWCRPDFWCKAPDHLRALVLAPRLLQDASSILILKRCEGEALW